MNKLAENIQEKDVLPLTQKEVDLIYLLRNVYRYGAIEIVMHDGHPQYTSKTVQKTLLGNLSTEEVDAMK